MWTLYWFSCPCLGQIKNESFLLYLKAVAYLFDKDFKLAKQYALQAIDSEPETIEPIMILIMALDGLDQYQQAYLSIQAYKKMKITNMFKIRYSTHQTNN